MLTGRRRILAFAALLLVAGGLAWANAMQGPFVFDDEAAIVRNPTIRHLWPLGEVLAPPSQGETVAGRPLLNLTFALNYAVGALDVTGYHLVNLLVHLGAALLLFGIVRRTLARPPEAPNAFAPAVRDAATPLGALVALIFLLHPLQTEAVTYLVQRAESLMALCYLGTLYAFIRSTGGMHPRRWIAAATIASLLGMATKEVMVTAPLVVLLYDRTFVAGSFAAAWRAHRGRLLLLGSTWLLLAVLVAGDARGNSAGLDTMVSSRDYLLTQMHALTRYLALVIWPDPLVFDYGRAVEVSVAPVAAKALVLLGLFVAACVAVRRRPAAGFAALACFLILAPTSSVVPIATQTIAEHRMYLVLAPLAALIVLGAQRLGGTRAALAGGAVWAALLGWRTVERNRDYRSGLALWTATVADRPDNPRAHYNLAHEMIGQGDLAGAQPHLLASLRIDSSYAGAYNDLGMISGRAGRLAEARDLFARALHFDPGHVEARFNHGTVLAGLGENERGIDEFREVERRDPAFHDLYPVMGSVMIRAGRYADAVGAYRKAVALKPDSVALEVLLGHLLVIVEQFPEAVAHYRAALQRMPAMPPVRVELGKALVRLGRRDEAAGEFSRALALDPANAEARQQLAALGGTPP